MTEKPLTEREALDTLYEKFYGETIEEVKNRLIHTLHEHGVHKVEGTYSGGHDEGGVDELTAYDKDGNALELEEKWDEPVRQACNDMLTTKFFSWALGASVYGSFGVDM